MASTGKVAGVNPEAFKIIDGRLYLNWNKKFGDKFAEKGDENIRKADENWMKVKKED